MAKLSQLISNSHTQTGDANTNFHSDQLARIEMLANIRSKYSNIDDSQNSSIKSFDPKVSAEKLQRMKDDDRLLSMYNSKISDIDGGTAGDNLAKKSLGTSFENKIDINNYKSKLLDRLDLDKKLYIDTITKIGEMHPGLLIKNSTFGGIVMNPIDNLNKLFDKLSSRIISTEDKPKTDLISKIDQKSYDLITNTDSINSKLNKLTYDMDIDQMSDLMTDFLLSKNIEYNFDTPDLLSFAKNSRPIVTTNGNSLLSLYNTENLNFIFNSKYIDDSYNTQHGVVNYFKDTFAYGFRERARELNTFFKNLDKMNNISNVDYLNNTYANGFTSNLITGYSLYKTSDGVEIGLGGIKNGMFGNKSSILDSVDFMSNEYADGFISKSIPLFSQYKTANSDPNTPIGILENQTSAIFANESSRLKTVDFLSNRFAYGFESGMAKLYSLFNNSKDGKSRSDIGTGVNIKNNITPEYNVNWFSDEFANGFVSNAQPMYSYYMDISRNDLGVDNTNQAVMFKNRSSWLKIQNNFSDEHVDGFIDNARFQYSYYKMKNGKRLGLLNGNIVGFFDSEYSYPDIKIKNKNEYLEYGWNFKGNPILMQIPGGESDLVVGQSNFFSNIYNIGFLKNKEFGESDFTNYDKLSSTYSDSQISTIFETLDLESKIGYSIYGNISAVDYFSNEYARGFILNSDKGYSYLQYKKSSNTSDIGFLNSDISGTTNTNYEFGSSQWNYKSISAIWDQGVALFNQVRVGQTYNAESIQLVDYNNRYNINRRFETELDRSKLVNETVWEDYTSKLYKRFMGVRELVSVDKLKVYDFKTENYVGVIQGTISQMKTAFNDSFDDNNFGRFSFTLGFNESPNRKLYKAYHDLDDRVRNDRFNKIDNSNFSIVGYDSNVVVGSISNLTQTYDDIERIVGISDKPSLGSLGNIAGRGLANTAIFTALSTIPGMEGFGELNKSPLVFQTMAGYIHGALASLISGVGVGDLGSRLTGMVTDVMGAEAGRSLDNLKNSAIQSLISSATDNIKTLVDTESLIKLGQIILGDKYTKSYAFYDAELAKNGLYGVQSPISGDNYLNTTVGFIGNRIDASPDDKNIRVETPQSTGFAGIASRLANSYDKLVGNTSKITSTEIKSGNVGLKNRLAMRSNGTAINLYNSNDTYMKVMENQIGANQIANFGKSRNAIGLSDSEDGGKDLIDFYFTIENYSDNNFKADRKTKYLHFRADIKNIPNNISAEWNSVSYVGRPDKFYIYQGFERKGGVEFSIAPDNKTQFKAMWEKVNVLMGLCMPMGYSNDISMVPPIVKCKIGNYLNNRYIIINSVNSNIDQSYPWDTVAQLPQIIDVSMDFTILYDDLPQTNQQPGKKWHVGDTNNNSEYGQYYSDQ